MSETIGFIGLGALGLPMATNLMDSGYGLRVYNRTASKADPLVARGAILANKPVDVVTSGGVVASIIWDDAALESIVTNDGFLDKLGAGGVHISMATVSPDISKKMAKLHAEHGCAYVEAPIFGRPEAAMARGLVIPFVGPKAAKERVHPLLEAMGGKWIFDLGEEAGAAVLAKLIGNFLFFSAGNSMREMIALARKNSVDPKPIIEMLTSTLLNSPIYQSYGKRMLEDSNPYRQTAIPLKDIGLLRANAQDVDSPTPVADLMAALLQAAAETAN